MSEIAINYKGSSIATMDASGTKTLQTSGKYCEGDIEVVYSRPSAPAPTLQNKSVAFTPATTIQTSSVTADAGYDGLSSVGITVNPIPSQYIVPSGTSSITSNGIYDITSFASVDVNVSGGGGGEEDGIIDRSISGAYTNSRVGSVGSYAFYQCSKLTAANMPNATTIYASAFYSCSKLATASFSSATTIQDNAFARCASLTEINLPSVASIGTSAFAYCSRISVAMLPKVQRIYSSAFRNCSVLMALYISASSVPTLSNVNAFGITPMSNSTYTGSFGSIYVPASLVSSYQTATNWMSYSARITSYVE